MNAKHPSVFEELKQIDALVDLQREPQLPVEHLPFTVRLVKTEEDLMKAVKVRYEGYARHKPDFARALMEPEEDDTLPNTVVMLAESKLDGSALGTVRVQINRDRPLNMEQSVTLPDWLQGRTLADARRLAVVRGGEGGLVKTVLFKALFLYWEHEEVDWAVVAARSPLTRTYESLLFTDALGGGSFIPTPVENNLPHRVLAFEIASAHARWQANQHRLLNFVINTIHPDIRVAPPSRFSMPSAVIPEIGTVHPLRRRIHSAESRYVA